MDNVKDLIAAAYRKTRKMIYHDRGNLETRSLFAQVGEHGTQWQEIELAVEEALFPVQPTDESESDFQNALDGIVLNLCPKSFVNSEKADHLAGPEFVSNIDLSDIYRVHRYNYFIICEPSLHLISTLWIMIVGPILDSKFSADSYGSRLDENAANIKSNRLFRYYPKDYAKWRDTAILRARRTIEEDKQNATIIGLDLKEFYYHIVVDWEKLEAEVRNSNLSFDYQNLALRLTKLIREICRTYKVKLDESLHLTHENISPDSTPLPLGLHFAPVLANWVLNDFDTEVQQNLNPTYYGRYVDDMLFVISSRSLPPTSEDTLIGNRFLNHYFVKRGLLRINPSKDEKPSYHITSSPTLSVQPSKIKIQHFDRNGSLGALDKFQSTIREIVSEFRALPEPIPRKKIEELCHNLKYDGSPHGLKSIKGFSIDRWQLSQMLTSSAMTRIFAADNKRMREESAGLIILFGGRVGIEFFDMWEKLFTVFVLGRQFDFLKKSYWDINFRINNIKASLADQSASQHNLELQRRVSTHLRTHLEISLAMAVSQIGITAIFNDKSWSTKRDRDLIKRITPIIHDLRNSNLLRHHYIGTPLINFTELNDTNINDDWTKVLTTWEDLQTDEKRLQDSPRFIHREEFDHRDLLFTSEFQAGPSEITSSII